jgi:hypothetical protein
MQRKTHFILNKERSIHRETNPSLTLLLSNLLKRGLSFEGKLSHPWMEWCVLILAPSASIYRLSYRWENSLGTWESTVGPVTEYHVEADGDLWQGRFDRSKGSADLAPPHLALCFLPVTGMRGPLWRFQVSRCHTRFSVEKPNASHMCARITISHIW